MKKGAQGLRFLYNISVYIVRAFCSSNITVPQLTTIKNTVYFCFILCKLDLLKFSFDVIIYMGTGKYIIHTIGIIIKA